MNANPNLKEVFQNGYNIYSQSNTAFFYRLEKARNEEKERKELKEKGLSKTTISYVSLAFSGNKIIKSLSLLKNDLSRNMKVQSYIGDKYKESIHNELFSLQLP